MDVTTVSSKFQVVIPKRVREQFGLSPGQTIQVIALPGRIELVPTEVVALYWTGWAPEIVNSGRVGQGLVSV